MFEEARWPGARFAHRRNTRARCIRCLGRRLTCRTAGVHQKTRSKPREVLARAAASVAFRQMMPGYVRSRQARWTACRKFRVSTDPAYEHCDSAAQSRKAAQRVNRASTSRARLRFLVHDSVAASCEQIVCHSQNHRKPRLEEPTRRLRTGAPSRSYRNGSLLLSPSSPRTSAGVPARDARFNRCPASRPISAISVGPSMQSRIRVSSSASRTPPRCDPGRKA